MQRPGPALLAFIVLLSPTLRAQEATDAAGPPAAPSQPPALVAPIPGLFDVDLPRLYAPGTFHLLLNPRFGDFTRRSYIRVPTGARWTLDDDLEFHAEAEAYLANGFRREKDGYGVGEITAGVKYVFPEWLRPDFKASFSLDAQVPVGSPPVELTDGLNHLTPALVLEHRSSVHPRLTTFGGFGLDFVSHSFVHGTPGVNEPDENSMSVNAGAIYDLGQLKWTLQAAYATTALVGHKNENIFSLQPSLLWFLPRKLTFNSKTQWILGFGVHTTWGPDGFNVSTGSRLRADITFGQVVNRLRGAFDFEH